MLLGVRSGTPGLPGGRGGRNCRDVAHMHASGACAPSTGRRRRSDERRAGRNGDRHSGRTSAAELIWSTTNAVVASKCLHVVAALGWPTTGAGRVRLRHDRRHRWRARAPCASHPRGRAERAGRALRPARGDRPARRRPRAADRSCGRVLRRRAPGRRRLRAHGRPPRPAGRRVPGDPQRGAPRRRTGATVLVVETSWPTPGAIRTAGRSTFSGSPCTGGRERTPTELAALLQPAGLPLQRVVETDAPGRIAEATAI